MADVEKGLPVRTEDDVDQKVQVKIVDATTPAQQAEVDSDGNLHVQVMGDRCDDQAEIALRLSEQGSPNGRGDYEADDNSCPDSSGLVAGIRSANNLATDQTEHITSVESGDTLTRAVDVSMHDEDGEPFGNAPAKADEELDDVEIDDDTEDDDWDTDEEDDLD